MRKIYLIAISLFFVFSCTIENDSEIEKFESANSKSKNLNLTNQKIASINYYVMNAAFTLPLCQPNYSTIPVTNDIELQFSEPLEYDTVLSFSLQKFQNSSLVTLPSPWIFVQANAGDKKIVLNASCELPELISCDLSGTTGTKSMNFRIKLVSAKYIGTDVVLNYGPDPVFNKNYYDATAYLYCLGGNWDPSGPPSGLN